MTLDSPYFVSQVSSSPVVNPTMPSWMAAQVRGVLQKIRGSVAGAQLARIAFSGTLDDARLVERAYGRLKELDPHLAEVLRCRVFAEMEPAQIAALLGSTPEAVSRDWQRAKLWFYRYLRQEATAGKPC